MQRSTPFYQHLTVQVLAAIAVATVLGLAFPAAAVQLKPLGDGYIRLIKMVIGPIIFITIVTGIASTQDLKKVGRVGGKALLYFEVMSTIALMIGMGVAHLLQPGHGIDVSKVEAGDVAQYVTAAKEQSVSGFLLHMLPDNAVGAFASGDILQIVVFAALFGAAAALLGERAQPVLRLLSQLGEVLFRLVGILMRAAPVGAFGAMAFTVGKFGIEALAVLGQLMGAVYATMALFVFVVLGVVCRAFGFRLWPLLQHIRAEILLVLGTSSSESALPSVMAKLESYGCSRSVVGLVVPTGYSFNLDGTSIYLSMAALFIAQAYGIELSLGRQLVILGLLMLTSKGAATVTGGGFVTLAATLPATGVLPVEGVALLLGVDRFMSEARAITNLIGNSVATVVIAKLEGEFHPPATPAHGDGPPPAPTP